MTGPQELGRFETLRRAAYAIDTEQRYRQEMKRRDEERLWRVGEFDPVDAADTADAADRFLREQETP